MFNDGSPVAKRTRQSLRAAASSNENQPSTSAGPIGYELRTLRQVKNREPKRKNIRNKKLMDLNNDCLLAIIKKMDLETLCNVVDTCDRLANLVKYYFGWKYTTLDFDSLELSNTDEFVSYETVEKVFRNFGVQLVSVSIDYISFDADNNNPNNVLLLMVQYCVHLKSLILKDYTINRDLANNLKPFLNKIENLELHYCTLLDCDLGPMVNLKKLKVNDADSDLWSDTLWKHFPKLEEAQFIDSPNLSNEAIIQFINLNPQLKRLAIIRCYPVSTAVYRAISTLENLEKFKSDVSGGTLDFDLVRNVEMDLMHLLSLKKLKVLTLDCLGFSVARFLEKFITTGISIRHLTLSYGDERNDDLFKTINKLNTLKTLRLNQVGNLNEEYILGFATNLKQLRQLHIKTDATLTRHGLKQIIHAANQLKVLKICSPNFIFTQKMYLEILDIIKRRKEYIKLMITIYGNGQQFSVPNDVANGSNEGWLVVNELNEKQNLLFMDLSFNNF